MVTLPFVMSRQSGRLFRGSTIFQDNILCIHILYIIDCRFDVLGEK